MSSRKLQQEFDKLQKKVAEGLQLFEEIYEKIGVTENPSLKDKLEGDLRKEIKKLQRCRDQVKQWLSDSSNKLDKGVLLDTRSRIENAMERFKEVEKVSKMKQFSNEGLELQTKLGARGLDEAKKNEAAKYVVDVLEELNRQNELLLGEMAQISHKKKLGAAQQALADLTTKFERNNSHILRLEIVLRNIENYQLEPEKIDEIKDDLDYYVENNQSADFIEYDDFYDVLEIEDQADDMHTQVQPQVQAPPPPPSPPKPVAQPLAPVSTTLSPKKSEPATKQALDLKHAHAEHRQEKKQTAHPRVTITIGNTITNSNSNSNSNANASSSMHANTTSAPTSAPSFSAAAASGSASNGAPTSAPISGPASSTRAPPPGLNQSKPATPVQAPAKLTVAEELKKKAMTHAAAAASAIKSPAPKPASTATTTSDAVHQAVSAAINNQLASVLPVLTKQAKRKDFVAPFWDNSANVAALAHSRLSNPLPFQAISQQLEASLLNCPDSFDLERPRQYNPVNVHPSSVDYPQEPMFELNAWLVMRKFDTDTLFFCFYYNEAQDALAKWNAARELLRRGWVFNLDTKQWFCKEERPKSRSILSGLQNNETGARASSYKYFDYENSWLVRRKDNFEFDAEWQRTF